MRTALGVGKTNSPLNSRQSAFLLTTKQLPTFLPFVHFLVAQRISVGTNPVHVFEFWLFGSRRAWILRGSKFEGFFFIFDVIFWFDPTLVAHELGTLS